MTRFAVAAAVLALVVSADLDGTARQERDNARCARWGVVFARNGWTHAETKRMAHRHCKRSGDTWVSDRYYTA